MAYPVQWLDSTFPTRVRTEELLRPDLEAGLVTEHDYRLAAAFLPGQHRYWPYCYALLTSGGAVAYGRYRKPTPMGIHRMMVVATVAGFFGAVYGQFRRAKAHWSFTQALENPAGFSQALQNVNKRAGGVAPLPWTLHTAKQLPPQADVHGNDPASRPDTWAPEGENTISTDAPANPVPAVSSQRQDVEKAAKPASRWDEIRATNARNAARSSSWDALRQEHERNQIPSQPSGRLPYGDSDKAEEQARFDAMLEAERLAASR